MVEDIGSAARRATAADRGRMARTLTAAFSADPVFTHLFPPGTSRREARLARLFELDTARSARRSGAWTAAGGAAAAAWFPPGRWASTTWENVRDGLSWVRLFGRQLRVGSEARSVMEAHHRPLPDHWYLLYLGVQPRHQGAGSGAP